MNENYRIRLPRWAELPEIDLYLEQMLSLLEKWMGESFYCEGKKLMTKTMVDKYV